MKSMTSRSRLVKGARHSKDSFRTRWRGYRGSGRNWQIFGSRARVECWEMVEGLIAELGGR